MVINNPLIEKGNVLLTTHTYDIGLIYLFIEYIDHQSFIEKFINWLGLIELQRKRPACLLSKPRWQTDQVQVNPMFEPKQNNVSPKINICRHPLPETGGLVHTVRQKMEKQSKNYCYFLLRFTLYFEQQPDLRENLDCMERHKLWQ